MPIQCHPIHRIQMIITNLLQRVHFSEHIGPFMTMGIVPEKRQTWLCQLPPFICCNHEKHSEQEQPCLCEKALVWIIFLDLEICRILGIPCIFSVCKYMHYRVLGIFDALLNHWFIRNFLGNSDYAVVGGWNCPLPLSFNRVILLAW